MMKHKQLNKSTMANDRLIMTEELNRKNVYKAVLELRKERKRRGLENNTTYNI